MTKPCFSALFALLLLPSVLAVAETVTFPSGEITLHGVLYKPEGTGPFPGVIYNHGSAPGMMSEQAFAALGPVFASHGWVFFGPYRRGQGLRASAGPYIGDQIAAAEKAGGAFAAAAGAVDGFGRVDVLLNNAGIMPIAPIEALKVDEWDRQIDVNIKGLLYGVAAALPHMQKQKSGHIINIASVFGIKMFAPGGTVYCATKAAVRALTEGLRMELHSQNIRCTMISPGAIATELSESSSDEATRKNLREFMKMAIPASAIARAIAYAIEQPVQVEVDEMVIRPTVQDF